MTKAPDAVTYARVVPCETFRIDLTIFALNDLQVKCGNVLNAYLNAPVMELIQTTLGTNFGNDKGNTAIVVRALYGLKSSGPVFCKNLGECMSGLGYKPCLADTYIWLNPEVSDDGVEYYSYILCYVDDILVVYHNARSDLDQIDQFINLR